MGVDDHEALIDRLLRSVPVRSRPGFTDAVMLRVAEAPQADAGSADLVPPWAVEAQPMFPWWTRALLEPVTLLAFVAAALLAGWPSHLLRASTRAASSLVAQFALVSPGGPEAWVGLLAATVVASLLVVGLAIRGTQTFFAASPTRPGASAPR